MTGAETAWRTLNMELVPEPCIGTNCIMKPEVFEAITGRDFFADPVGVARDAYRRVGANLCPQLALPHARGSPSAGDWHSAYAVSQHWHSPEQVKSAIEALPHVDELHRTFRFEEVRDQYARSIQQYRERTRDDILWISDFGQADFMGGYSRWGYENYLACLAMYPDTMRRYYE